VDDFGFAALAGISSRELAVSFPPAAGFLTTGGRPNGTA